jgi:hypothetical protein
MSRSRRRSWWLSAEGSIGAGSCIMHGAVLAAEGGPVQIGAGCVIMENAALRGTGWSSATGCWPARTRS